MVLQQIKNILGLRSPYASSGALYKDRRLRMDNASIDVTQKELVFAKEGEVEEISLDSVAYLDFRETKQSNPAVILQVDTTKYVFEFRYSLPQSVLQFYGKVSDKLPQINGWEVMYVSDFASFSRHDREAGAYQVVSKLASLSLLKSNGLPFLRVYEQYKVHRRGDYLENVAEFFFDQKEMSFTWFVVGGGETAEGNAYRVQFQILPTFLAFLSAFLVASRKEAPEDLDYLQQMEIENYGEEEYSSEPEEEASEEESSDYHHMPARKRDVPAHAVRPVPGNVYGGRTREKNRTIAVDKDKTLISRGSSIGVFAHSNDGMDYLSSISSIVDAEKSRIEPDKMLIQGSGNAVFLTDTEKKDKLHKVDLDTGKVAQTWENKADIEDFFSSAKTLDGVPICKEFIGVSSNGIFKIDPRTRSVEEGKEYATKTKFSSGDANAKGEFAIASLGGDVRLYDKLDKRAKTLLPSLGDAISGVFISPSGKYIVCTCKSYLIFVTTESNGISGFRKSLGKDKPVPKKLLLRPEHLHYFGKEVNFTMATISTDREEKYVIVGNGPWVILWNIESVLKGNVFHYHIKKHAQNIVSSSFVPGDSDRIVVAMDDDIQMLSRTALRKPKKENVYQKQNWSG